MYVLELFQRGVWLESIDDQSERHETESLIHLMVNCIADAALALASFEEVYDDSGTSGQQMLGQLEGQRQREETVAARLESELPAHLSMDELWRARDDIRERATIEAKHASWLAGEVPRAYAYRKPFVHAKSFLYALDTLVKSIEQIVGLTSSPPEVSKVLGDLKLAFPDLVGVRNSAHHVEDRVQGKQFGKKIDLQPIDSDAISAPVGGALVVDMLNNNRYGGTLANGTLGEVEVSRFSAEIAQSAVQRILDAYKWRGPTQHLP